MTSGDEYRIRAATFSARARIEANAGLRAEFGALARGYTRLAEQADRNLVPNDVVYETPTGPDLRGIDDLKR